MDDLVVPQFFALPPLALECGETLTGAQLCYETYGQLNASKDNAILVCHALTGDAHAALKHNPQDRKAGWWDNLIGAGKAIDTDRYFVLCSNVLGGCAGSTGPSSPISSTNGKPAGLNFPFITIKDMVHAQHELVQGLGIKQLHACLGGSMGGMQALEWAIEYPMLSASYILLATAAQQSPQNIALQEVGRRAIMNDPDWQEGNYYGSELRPDRGLAIARMLAHISYLSDETMKHKFGRRTSKNAGNSLGYALSGEFEVESYLDYQGSAFIRRFDPNSYLYVTRAVDYFDYAEGKLEGALAALTELSKPPKFFLISFSSDWLYPPAQSREMVNTLKALGLPVTYREFDSLYGHDAFLVEGKALSEPIANFLAWAQA